MRVSFQGNPRRSSAIYLDLRSAGYAVEIAASGYRVSVDHTMDFRGGFQQHSLPDPVEPPGPARVLTQFRSLANLADDHDWIRCLLWLLAAFRPPDPTLLWCCTGPRQAASPSPPACCARSSIPINFRCAPSRARPRLWRTYLAWRNHVLAFDDVLRPGAGSADPTSRAWSRAVCSRCATTTWRPRANAFG
jgi:hypothetical protein